MSAQTWMNVGIAGLWVATIGQVIFVTLYGLSPWWRHYVGRALFIKSATLAVVLIVTLINSHWVYPHQLEVSSLLMWAIALSIIWQAFAMLRQKREVRAERRRRAMV